jgi:hypothetical protein
MMGLFAAVHESVLLPCQPRRAVSAIGGKSADICSARFSHFDPVAGTAVPDTLLVGCDHAGPRCCMRAKLQEMKQEMRRRMHQRSLGRHQLGLRISVSLGL